jgi:hypothetical protein
VVGRAHQAPVLHGRIRNACDRNGTVLLTDAHRQLGKQKDVQQVVTIHVSGVEKGAQTHRFAVTARIANLYFSPSFYTIG